MSLPIPGETRPPAENAWSKRGRGAAVPAGRGEPPNAWGRGRGSADKPRDPAPAKKEKPLPKSIDEMPKFDEGPKKVCSTSILSAVNFK